MLNAKTMQNQLIATHLNLDCNKIRRLHDFLYRSSSAKSKKSIWKYEVNCIKYEVIYIILTPRAGRIRLKRISWKIEGQGWAFGLVLEIKDPWECASSQGLEGLVVKKRGLVQTLIEMTSLYTVISSMLVGLYKFISNRELRCTCKKEIIS